MNIVEVKNLSVQFQTQRGLISAVQNLSFDIRQGETFGIVGESGSGKSVASLALMGLLPSNTIVQADKMQFMRDDLLTISEKHRQNLRGGEMGMIFQDPMTSLNPSFTVGFQLMEVLQIHQPEFNKKQRYNRSVALLKDVGIAFPEARMKAYPHQLSGGMCQRVMIAMAIACQPELLIADEPTTALDVTIQAQILDLLDKLQQERKMSMILITHNIGVVAQHTDRLMVMYAGQAVEIGNTKDVIERPSHPYTKALLDSLPANHTESEHRTKLTSIPGMVPDLSNRPSGCQMHPRCAFVQDRCRVETPEIELSDEERTVRCFYPLEGE
jgi:oligopeptide/dipeptide ABC transporter ATP-binding protein